MVSLQVRPDDCDSFGHVNNAAYASFVQLAVVETLRSAGFDCDWIGGAGARWWVKSLRIEYRSAGYYGEELIAHPWLETADPLALVFGCEIRCNGQTRARSRSTWLNLNSATSETVPVPQKNLTALPVLPGSPAKPQTHFTVPPGIHPYRWRHQVLLSELDPFGGVHLRAIYAWLEESIFSASAQGGWPLERWMDEGFVTLQAGHDTEFFEPPRPHERIEVTSRLIDVRRLMGTWLVEVRRQDSGELLLHDYSTGVYLDLSGRPAAPPSQIAADLQTGGTAVHR